MPGLAVGWRALGDEMESRFEDPKTLIRIAGSDSTNAAQCGESGIPKLTGGIREQAVRSTVIEHFSMKAAVN